MKEKDYYGAIQTWFLEQKKCAPIGVNYKMRNLELLTADVIAMKENLWYVCELKNYPYPVGSQGWGSIGQALALRREADFVYVGCVASDGDDSENNSWRRVTAARTVQKLLSYLNISFPRDFEEYCNALKAVFQCFFGDLGIGLLVVRESYSGNEQQSNFRVIEVVGAKQTTRALSSSACS
jgi:hypothetical protein